MQIAINYSGRIMLATRKGYAHILIYDWVPISREITLLWLIDNYKKPAGK